MDKSNKQTPPPSKEERKPLYGSLLAYHGLRQRKNIFVAESAEEPVVGTISTQEGSLEQETVTFLDNQTIRILDMGQDPDVTRTQADHQESNSLGDFLCRPVHIATLDWTPGTTFQTPNGFIDVSPWQFLALAYLPKMQNYRLFRSKSLRIQVRINGSPFHYGRIYASYIPGRYANPYSGMNNPTNSTLAPTNYGSFNSTTDPLKTHWSQYPGVYIDPSTNDVVEFDLPFFWPSDYLSLTASGTTDAFQDIGTLKFWELTPLQHSNGATDPISLTVSGWFVDPILTMPTSVTPFAGESSETKKPRQKSNVPKSGDTSARSKRGQDREKFVTPPKKGVTPGENKSQGNDEYGKGVVSAPASALESFAGTLEKVPFIGAYATATKIAAGKISQIAKLFGYSRPVILDNQTFVTQRPFGSLATTSGDEPLVKLTLDPKQEVTIDPVVTGLSDTDEMSFAHLFKRESLILQVPWSTTQARGTNLANIAIHPQVCPMHISTNLAKFNTALSWASDPFLYWRGSLNYRIQVVASQMHRGRIAVVYQPVKHAGSSNPGSHITYTQYMDLTECRDVTFTVRYTHYSPYLAMHLGNPTFVGSGAPSFNQVISGQTNGIISFFVLNELGAPINTSAVSLNIFISAGDDFMVAAPGAIAMEEMSPFSAFLRDTYTAESNEYFAESADYTTTNENDAHIKSLISVLNGDNDTVPDVNHESLVFFGEQVVSLRALLKRYCYYRPIIWDDGGSYQGICEATLSNPTMPVMRGPSGSDESRLGNWSMGTNDADGPYNYVQTTLLTYYKYGYAAWRGSIRYKYVVDKNGCSNFAQPSLYVQRNSTATYGTSQFLQFVDSDVSGTRSDPLATRLDTLIHNTLTNTLCGVDVNSLMLKNGIEFEMPYYFNQRFIWNRLPAPANNLEISPNDSYYQQHFATARASSKIAFYDAPGSFNNAPYLSSLWTAIGEDFGFHYFLAAPVMSFTEPNPNT